VLYLKDPLKDLKRWCPHCKPMINRYPKQLEREKPWLQSGARAGLSMAGPFRLAYANMTRWKLSEMVKRVSPGEGTDKLSSGSRCLCYTETETRNRYTGSS